MKYLSTHFIISLSEAELQQACRELLADSLADCGYDSFEDTDDGLIGYVQDSAYRESEVDNVIEQFPINDVNITYSTEAIPDQDWNAEWEAIGFEPIEVADAITIYDAHKTVDSTMFSTPITIGIQASNAFGTGTHETTRMVLSTLTETSLEGKRMLDCGCGTGILAIASLFLGAKAAIGYDIDEWSSNNAMHNANLNGVGDRLQVYLGDSNILNHVDGTFDVVVANINRNILLADMPQFFKKMSPNATLILSGFYESDAPMLLEKAANFGLKEIGRKTDNDWCCLRLESER